MTGISANAQYILSRFGYERGFALLKEAGFDACDVSLDGQRHPEHPLSGAGYEKEARRIRAAADSAGIIINQTHAPFSYPLDIWEKSDQLMPILKRSLEISAVFGAETAIVHPYHHPVYMGHEDEMFEKNMEYYGELIPTAEAVGVKICAENMFQVDERRGHIVHDTCSSIYDFVRYIDTLSSEYVVACLDIGHIVLVQQKDEPADFIRALGQKRLKALHIHDNNYRADEHKLPYEGRIDWDAVTKALGEIDYQGYFTYETSGNLKRMDDGFVPVGLKYMADLARHMCAKIDANRPAK